MSAADRKAHLYFSKPATLIHPAMWTRIGETQPGKVGQSGKAVPLAPMEWKPDSRVDQAVQAGSIRMWRYKYASRWCSVW